MFFDKPKKRGMSQAEAKAWAGAIVAGAQLVYELGRYTQRQKHKSERIKELEAEVARFKVPSEALAHTENQETKLEKDSVYDYCSMSPSNMCSRDGGIGPCIYCGKVK